MDSPRGGRLATLGRGVTAPARPTFGFPLRRHAESGASPRGHSRVETISPQGYCRWRHKGLLLILITIGRREAFVNRRELWAAAAAATAVTAVAHQATAAKAPDTWDGLIKVKSKRADAVYLQPGADFRPYTKVMLDPTEV